MFENCVNKAISIPIGIEMIRRGFHLESPKGSKHDVCMQ